MTNRYEIRKGNHPNGKFGVWDRLIEAWQVFKRTRADAEAWIAAKEQADKNPTPSTLQIRMPLRD